MKTLKSIRISDKVFFILCSVIIIVAGTIATPYRTLIARPNTIYLGADFYVEDYSIYAGDILQGQKGRWTVMDKHTTEPHQGTFIHEEYLLWGKFMGLFGINNLLAYQLSRVVFGITMLISLYYFLRFFFPMKIMKISFFLILFSAGISIITKTPDGHWSIQNRLDWFTEIDTLQRFTVLMHYLIGNITFLLSMLFLTKAFLHQKITILKHQIHPIIPAIVSGIGMALIHPANLLVFYMTISIFLLFVIVIKWSSSNFKLSSLLKLIKTLVVPFFLFGIITSPILLYYRSQFFLPVWNQISAWDNTSQYVIPIMEYGLTIGLTFFIAPIGFLVLFFKKNDAEYSKINNQYISLLLFSWILAVFILIYFSYPFLHTSQIRFMQNFIFIPFGILSAVTISFLAQKLSLFVSYLSHLRNLGNLSNIFISLSLLTIILVSLPNYYRSMQLKFIIFNPLDGVAFPDKPWIDALNWLGKNSKPEEVVLSAWQAGHTIPYVSGNTVYSGHVWATINKKGKDEKRDRFLQNKMTLDEARNFVKETTAKYLFFGYQEKYSGLKPENYPFLEKIFDNTFVQIYKINI